MELPGIGCARRGSDFLLLIKARLVLLVLFATAIGFAIATDRAINGFRMACTLIGTGLTAAGSMILNQVVELHWDRLMTRTRNRPLPAGHITRAAALSLGSGMIAGGLAILALGTTPLAVGFTTLAIAVYLAGYTPMKRRSPACVPIGAVAGALPPVIGWAAASDGALQWETGVLFGVLFAWQIPHLAAILYIHRDDYAGAGFALLYSNQRSPAIQAFVFSAMLAAITWIPVSMATTGIVYLIGTIGLNALLLVCSGLFLLEPGRSSARRLFAVSMFYLPVFLTLLLLGRK
jgi:protoheme IX farnesyltransferase